METVSIFLLVWLISSIIAVMLALSCLLQALCIDDKYQKSSLPIHLRKHLACSLCALLFPIINIVVWVFNLVVGLEEMACKTFKNDIVYKEED